LLCVWVIAFVYSACSCEGALGAVILVIYALVKIPS